MREEDFLLLEQGVNDDLIKYSIDVHTGGQNFKNKLETLLTVDEQQFYQYQSRAIDVCVNILSHSTLDFLKEVGRSMM